MHIWKFQLEPGATTTLLMPYGAEVIDAVEQHGMISLYALVDPDQKETVRAFRAPLTGQEIEEGQEARTFIGSVRCPESWVAHVFEVVATDDMYRTASGKVLTDQEIAELSNEAEQGYDVEQLKERADQPEAKPFA